MDERRGRLLERQADAERIAWDTQEFEKAPTPNFVPPPPKRILAPKVPKGSLTRPKGRPTRVTRSASASLPPAELPRTRGRQLDDTPVADDAIEEEEEEEEVDGGAEKEERPIYVTEELPNDQDYRGGERSEEEEEDSELEKVLESSPILEGAPRFKPSQFNLHAFAMAPAPRKIATPVAGSSRQRVQAPVDLDGGFQTQSDDSDMEVITKTRQKKVRQLEQDSDSSSSDVRPRKKVVSSSRRRSSSIEAGQPINMYRQNRNGVGNRIAWTEKEDVVLLAEMAKWGTQYRKIIERHGENGTVSRRLKHRNNVSLKDRAVTLKRQSLIAGRKPPSCFHNGQSHLPPSSPTSSLTRLVTVTVPLNKLPKEMRARQTATPSESED